MFSSLMWVAVERIWFIWLMLSLSCVPHLQAQKNATSDEADPDQAEDLTNLAAFNVKADRLEEFGFRVGAMFAIPGPSYAWVKEVFPNTAAAKAGLRPGDIILKVDGKKRSLVSMHRLSKAQDKKWAELAAGKKSVSWVFDVQDPVTKISRTVTMTVPSPPPHWGSARWSAPEGRAPAVIAEPGPLARRAGEILDNGIWTKLEAPAFLGVKPKQQKEPLLGFEWRIVEPDATHRMWVSQQRGKTEILLEHRSLARGTMLFLTTPAGARENKRHSPPKKNKKLKLSPAELDAAFRTEVDFWLTKVGRVSGRWPFELLSGAGGVSDIAIIRRDVQASGADTAPSATFLALPVADETQKALFADALGKVGADQEHWAYTETSNGFGDERVTTARIDPSKPEGMRSTLLLVDGKKPKAAVIQQWRDEGRGVPEPLGELPAIASIVDVRDVRVFADETTSVVFELPLKSSSDEFPADKCQALFRVNKTHRAFEAFSIKLRESFRVAGVAKVTDAGIEVRFESFDPALAPQPVLLKAGGGVNVLLVKFKRSFETKRTKFTRVVPAEE